MIWFVLGFIAGFISAYIVMAFCFVAKKSDEAIERMWNEEDKKK